MSLTIEFAGIATLVRQRARREASVVLVDLGAAGFHAHHAALGISGGPGLSCPDPDLSIAVPGQPMELGVWGLQGTDIEIVADSGPLHIVDDPVDSTEPPPPNAESVRWLPEIGELCQSRTLATRVPISSRLRLRTGRVTSTAAAHPLVRVVFEDDGEPIGPARYLLARFLVEIPCAKAVLKLDAQRELTFDSDRHVLISNTCVCEPKSGGRGGHFYAHYLLLDQRKREPRIRRTEGPRGPASTATFSFPEDPEHCFTGFVDI